jgi:hypothetical protein
MRVFQIQDDWGMANLRMAERPEPRPGAGQVRAAHARLRR